MEKGNVESLTEKRYDFPGKNEICCSCPICYSLFNDNKTNTPRLLQCGHTACHACLQNIINESVIACPICRGLTPVMHSKVENLKKNFALLDVYSGQEAIDIDEDAQDGTFALFDPKYEENEADHGHQSGRELSCKPTTDHQSRAIHSIGLIILMGNMFFDWLVNSHVNKIAAMERGKFWNSSAVIPSLKKLHDIGLDWNAIQFVFLEFAIFTSICFALQFFGTMLTWCFTDNNKAPFQKILVWASLFLNDLPQCILTAIVTYATDDVYIPYFCSTVLGVVGNYIIFLALSNIGAFHYPKVIWCHVALTVICLIIQIAHVTKAHIT